MSYADTMPSHRRTLTAFFDTQAAADRAYDDLVAAGVPREDINRHSGASSSTAPLATSDRGWWTELKEMFLPDEDRHVYAEGLRRGGHLLVVRTQDTNYAQVVEVLDQEGSVDMDEREANWKSEGWKAYDATSAAAAIPVGTLPNARPAAALSPSVGAAPPVAVGHTDDQTVSLYEEQLLVGKRDVSHGKVRLRSFVVETPVTEQVNLHSETVQVDRRPVNRAVPVTDAMFQDKVIETEEFAEEAVVSKTAHITEEISLRKVASDETRTISDTLRRTEVEVEDQRKRGVTATAGMTTIRERMNVISADGHTMGTVDHVDGTVGIKLAKLADGQHHIIPAGWVDHVDQHVHLNQSAVQIRQSW